MDYFAAMFTGIIEAMGEVTRVEEKGGNKTFWLRSPLSAGFRVDQSVAHDGACLTVEEIKNEEHRVTAIAETLEKTNLGSWQAGSRVNLEQCLVFNGRLDGHLVQGHVDTTAECIGREEKDGSWEFTFRFPGRFAPLLIEKGSVCVNGISLTAWRVRRKTFRVAIIPYTFEHTNIGRIQPGERVNIEFDMVGKYLVRHLSLEKKS